jgi:hypothetical protein
MAVLRGIAGLKGAMRAIAPSIPPHVCPWKGRPRPTPRYCAAGAGGVAII